MRAVFFNRALNHLTVPAPQARARPTQRRKGEQEREADENGLVVQRWRKVEHGRRWTRGLGRRFEKEMGRYPAEEARGRKVRAAEFEC